jgi:hypothetical protein
MTKAKSSANTSHQLLKRLTLFKVIKNRQKTFAGALLIILFAAIGSYVLVISRAAGGGTLSLTPASQSLSLGSSITITIKENSGTDTVNAIEADLTYDQTKLQFVSIDTSTGPFNNIVAQKSGGNGVVNLSAASSPAVTGTQTVATVTFKAIGTGTTSINFAGTSAIVRSTDTTNILGTSTGGSYTISDSTAPTTPTALTMASHTVTTVNLTWTASTDNVAVTGYKIYRNGTQVGTNTTNSFADSGLTPGTSYTYTVAAYDAANNTSAQSTAYSASTTTQPGDINGDGHVNATDLSILATNFGKSGMILAQGDLNGDGVVNVFDLSLLAAHWGI